MAILSSAFNMSADTAFVSCYFPWASYSHKAEWHSRVAGLETSYPEPYHHTLMHSAYHILTHPYTHTHTNTHTHTYTQTHTHSHTHPYTLTHTQDTYKYTLAYKHKLHVSKNTHAHRSKHGHILLCFCSVVSPIGPHVDSLVPTGGTTFKISEKTRGGTSWSK